MIPLRDNIPSRRFPLVNYAIITANLLAFVHELRLGGGLEPFLREWGVVPRELVATLAARGEPTELATLVTSMFLHGGVLHFAGNMLFLYIFGDNIEDRMGHAGYLAFYLVAGTLAALGHVMANPSSTLPTIGASGAVAGVMGAYLLLYPKARVLTAVPIFIIIQLVELPAVLYLGLWFALQFFSGTAALSSAAASGGVAWWAHISGFVVGAVCVLLFRLRHGRAAYLPRRSHAQR